jgi:hypothetical protein
MQVVVANDLTLVLKGETVRLTPTEGFRLAERLIRRSTAEMVRQEAGFPEEQPAKRGSRRAS